MPPSSTQPKAKIYHLENEKQFWEISVDGTETKIRTGKIGCKGRAFPSKKHVSTAKAVQFALRHVNAKIMLGFENTEASNYLKKTPVQRATSHKKPWKGPPKKRESARKLAKQPTLLVGTPSSSAGQGGAASSKKAQNLMWRKPPRKQTTIRRLAQKESLRRRALSNRRSSVKKHGSGSPSDIPGNQSGNKVSRQTTMILGGSSPQPPLLKRRTSSRLLVARRSSGEAPTLDRESPLLRNVSSVSAGSSCHRDPPVSNRTPIRRQLFS